MIQFFLLVSRQGKCRLSKWYSAYSDKEKRKMVREVSQLCLNRPQKLCNFLGRPCAMMILSYLIVPCLVEHERSGHASF